MRVNHLHHLTFEAYRFGSDVKKGRKVLESNFEKINNLTENQSIIIEDDGSICSIGLIRGLWEQIKGFFGYVDLTREDVIQQRLITLIEYGHSHALITKSLLEKFDQMVEKISSFSKRKFLSSDRFISTCKNMNILKGKIELCKDSFSFPSTSPALPAIDKIFSSLPPSRSSLLTRVRDSTQAQAMPGIKPNQTKDEELSIGSQSQPINQTVVPVKGAKFQSKHHLLKTAAAVAGVGLALIGIWIFSSSPVTRPDLKDYLSTSEGKKLGNVLNTLCDNTRETFCLPHNSTVCLNPHLYRNQSEPQLPISVDSYPQGDDIMCAVRLQSKRCSELIYQKKFFSDKLVSKFHSNPQDMLVTLPNDGLSKNELEYLTKHQTSYGLKEGQVMFKAHVFCMDFNRIPFDPRKFLNQEEVEKSA